MTERYPVSLSDLPPTEEQLQEAAAVEEKEIEKMEEVTYDMNKRDKRLLKMLDHVNKTLKTEALTALREEYEPTPCIPTGLPEVDITLNGGFPKARIIECFGPEGGGKTTLALYVGKSAQKEGGIIHFQDAEHKFDESILEVIGVDRKAFVFHQPDSAEEAYDELYTWLDTATSADLGIVDSIAGLYSSKEVEAPMDANHMAIRARANSQGIGKIKGKAAKSGCTLIFVNQLRMRPDVMFGNPEDTPGGRTLKFAAAMRLEIRAGKPIQESSIRIGHTCNIKAIKSNHCRPHQKVQVPLVYGQGFELDRGLFAAALTCGVIIQRGSMYEYGDGHKIKGQKRFVETLKTDKKLKAWIENAVKQKSVQGVGT